MATTSTTPPSALNSSAPLPWEQPTATPAPPAAATVAPAATAAPGVATAAQVDPNALSNQVAKVSDPNSEISQRATAIANEQSNDKGLLNSSMAVGAARNAVLQSAIPIAQGDVAAQEQNAQAATGVSQSNATNTQQTNLQNAQQTNAINTVNAGAQNTQIMAGLDQANKIQLAGINTQYQSFLNSSGTASSLYNSTMTQISQIQNNPNLDAAHKTDAINQLTALLQSGLSNMSAISGLNLSAGLDFSNLQHAATATPAATAQTTQQQQAATAYSPLSGGGN